MIVAVAPCKNNVKFMHIAQWSHPIRSTHKTFNRPIILRSKCYCHSMDDLHSSITLYFSLFYCICFSFSFCIYIINILQIQLQAYGINQFTYIQSDAWQYAFASLCVCARARCSWRECSLQIVYANVTASVFEYQNYQNYSQNVLFANDKRKPCILLFRFFQLQSGWCT